MIKKTLLISIALILISKLNIFSQKIEYGFTAGFDVVNIHSMDKPINTQLYYPMISFNLNGFVEHRLCGILSISAEPGFIQKGGKHKDGTRIQINYIQLPILANFYISDKLFVSIGPEYSLLINAKSRYKSKSNNITHVYKKTNEMSGNIGAIIGINYYFTNRTGIGLSYSHGLTYISKVRWIGEDFETLGESKDYNQYFQLALRYRI
jgi:hypothetical protein